MTLKQLPIRKRWGGSLSSIQNNMTLKHEWQLSDAEKEFEFYSKQHDSKTSQPFGALEISVIRDLNTTHHLTVLFYFILSYF